MFNTFGIFMGYFGMEEKTMETIDDEGCPLDNIPTDMSIYYYSII